MMNEIKVEQMWDINAIAIWLKNKENDEEFISEVKCERAGFQLFEEPKMNHSKHGYCHSGLMQVPIHEAEEMVVKLQNAIDDFYKVDKDYLEYCAEQDFDEIHKNHLLNKK